ncbi:MAG: TIGR03557 family F420-dependent LLM class oxidoreductase [Candidatus Binatia bacterium]
MLELGYKLCSEEHTPNELLRYASHAEEAGFTWAGISDHFHPWVDEQGQSPFVWSVLGGLAWATERLLIGTWVTCPIMRVSPAIVAQAAATVSSMLPGRFFLGLGSGENLNEHITGRHWPEPKIRLEMLEESVAVIRELWKGEEISHYGKYFTVEKARIYTLPADLPPIYLAASGKSATDLAGKVADGLIAVAPDASQVRRFEELAGAGKPKLAEITVCWAESEEAARKTALKSWPNMMTEGTLSTELARPAHFEMATKNANEEEIGEKMPCGSDPEIFLKAINEYADAGFNYISLHQVGPQQEEFIEFCRDSVLPRLRKSREKSPEGTRNR